MEQLVRPFQQPAVIATLRIHSVRDKVTVDPAIITWGAVGKLPEAIQQTDEFDGINFKIGECDDSNTELSRETSDIRVQNPDDPTQYVMVRRISKIAFKKKSRKKFIGVWKTETTAFAPIDPWLGSSFDVVPEEDGCHSSFKLHTPP